MADTNTIWSNRINDKSFFTRLFWSAVYYAGRFFSLGRWSPLKNKETTAATQTQQSGSNVAAHLPKSDGKFASLKALILGADKTCSADCARWDEYAKSNNFVWFTLPKRIERNKLITPRACDEQQSVATLFNEVFANYQSYYHQYAADLLEIQKYDEILLDRISMHGFVIDNPFTQTTISSSMIPKDEVGKCYLAFQNGLFNDDNKDHHYGALNQSILCLLFLNLLTAINKGGKLILDTAYLDDKHVALLNKFFDNSNLWNYNETGRQGLQYASCYASGSYLQPKFVEFSGRNNQVPDFMQIQKQLYEITINKVSFSSSKEDVKAKQAVSNLAVK